MEFLKDLNWPKTVKRSRNRLYNASAVHCWIMIRKCFRKAFQNVKVTKAAKKNSCQTAKKRLLFLTQTDHLGHWALVGCSEKLRISMENHAEILREEDEVGCIFDGPQCSNPR